MSLTKIFTCDICKETTDENLLLEVTIETETVIARYGPENQNQKHAHKTCLIKVGLLLEVEELPPEVSNVFLDAFKIEKGSADE